jgi:hypothetical protein
MRKFVTGASIALAALAGLPSDLLAQSPVAIASLERPAAVEVLLGSTFNAYPKGGAALTTRIADLVVADPSLVAGLAAYLKAEHGLNAAQKQAAREGLVQALVRLNVYGQQTPPPGLTPEQILMLGGLAGVGVLIGVAASNSGSDATPPVKASDN